MKKNFFFPKELAWLLCKQQTVCSYINLELFCLFQLGKKRIRLVLDPEKENSSAGEESSTEVQRDRLPNSHGNINGNIYLAQNGTIIRTRRLPQQNNLKLGSPCRLGKQFRKLEKLGVTHEEPTPVSIIENTGKDTENGIGTCIPANNNQSSMGTDLRSFSSKNKITKVLTDSNSSRSVNEEQDTCIDNHEDGHIESHAEHAVSDGEELWMGPWNSLHIPMTKL